MSTAALSSPNGIKLQVTGMTCASCVLRIEKTLNALTPGSRVEIDARDCRRIDPDVLQLLHDFRHTAAERGIDYRLVAVPDLAVAGATSH